jgi:hypothetical protein
VRLQMGQPAVRRVLATRFAIDLPAFRTAWGAL